MLECVANLSEGRRTEVVEDLARVAGRSVLDVHVDADHHRSVFTLAGPAATDAEAAARALARAAAERLDLTGHTGVHPRIGAVDVVPFVALPGSVPADAVRAAREFAAWITAELGVPAHLYGDADPEGRSLPEVRAQAPGAGGDPGLGAVAVGALAGPGRGELRPRARRRRGRARSPRPYGSATADSPACARSASGWRHGRGPRCR